MERLSAFHDILSPNAALAPYSCFGVGGAAEYLAHPRDADQLVKLLGACREEGIPHRVLGAGSNVLIPDDGVKGVVIRLTAPSFQEIQIEGSGVLAGAGASLADLISRSCQASLSGLETLVGFPGTVGGAVRHNVGDRTGDIGQHVQSVTVLDEQGTIGSRSRSDIRFGYRQSSLEDVILLSVRFELEEENPDDLVRRIKKIWIARKATQPFGFQKAGCVFRNPRGLSAADLIEKAGLRGSKVGGAELSDRNPIYIVAQPGATSRDVRSLIDLVKGKVEQRLGVAMELHVDLW